MCLLIALHRLRSESPLVVAANRDELFARPAVSMAVLRTEAPRILGGRDLLLQGTWMAVNEHGVIAALTNASGTLLRDPSKRSRGELPLMLAMYASAEAAAQALISRLDPASYNPCWIFVGDRDHLFYIELQPGAPLRAEQLPPGIHVLENQPLTPPSVKAAFIRDRVERALAQCQNLQPALYDVLRSHELPPAAQTSTSPLRPAATFAACVHGAANGTRTAAIVQVPAARQAAARPRIAFTDGPPCTQPLQSAEGLWER
jgi:uncharacterized protein with NRDE domain